MGIVVSGLVLFRRFHQQSLQTNWRGASIASSIWLLHLMPLTLIRCVSFSTVSCYVCEELQTFCLTRLLVDKGYWVTRLWRQWFFFANITSFVVVLRPRFATVDKHQDTNLHVLFPTTPGLPIATSPTKSVIFYFSQLPVLLYQVTRCRNSFSNSRLAKCFWAGYPFLHQ